MKVHRAVYKDSHVRCVLYACT